MSKLIELRVSGFKSLDAATLHVEAEGCTSLVGANNSGKSSFLRALLLFFNPTLTMTEDERRRGYTENLTAECVFEMTRPGKILAGDFPAGKRFTISRDLSRPSGYTVHGLYEVKEGESRNTIPDLTQVAGALPSFLQRRASTFPYVQQVDAASQEPAVQILIKKFQLASPSATVARLQSNERAKREVYQLSKNVWKSSDIGPFDYVAAGTGVIFTIADAEARLCALSDMGEGIQRALSVALQVDDLRTRVGDQDLVLVIDEPENSLHPRAQRDLFSYLDNINNAQVLCATHSPCMIDMVRPTSIRTLTLDRKLGATRVLDRKHISDNLETVRLALGVLPIDSLSFGFVNIVVEGAIDLLVYPVWADTLRKAKKLELDLALVRFLGGAGSSTPVYFDVAISTGMPTMVVLDNDGAGRAYAGKIRRSIERRYELDYEAVHFLKKGEGDADIESVLPEDKLLASINQRCTPRTAIEAADLSRDPVVKRSKNIEDFLGVQNIEFDEFKTEITLEVARGMTSEEVPSCVTDFFNIAAELLKGTDQHVKPKGQ